MDSIGEVGWNIVEEHLIWKRFLTFQTIFGEICFISAVFSLFTDCIQLYLALGNRQDKPALHSPLVSIMDPVVNPLEECTFSVGLTMPVSADKMRWKSENNVRILSEGDDRSRLL